MSSYRAYLVIYSAFNYRFVIGTGAEVKKYCEKSPVLHNISLKLVCLYRVEQINYEDRKWKSLGNTGLNVWNYDKIGWSLAISSPRLMAREVVTPIINQIFFLKPAVLHVYIRSVYMWTKPWPHTPQFEIPYTQKVFISINFHHFRYLR